jgi:hypothetical protein
MAKLTLTYRLGADIVVGDVMGAQAGCLLVAGRLTGKGNKGLESRSCELVRSHQAISLKEYNRIYDLFGGEQLFDEDGDPI